MKKIVITLSIVLISLLGYSQVTNVQELRVASESTVVSMNIPVGTKVFCITEKTYWVANQGIATGWKVDANTSFTQLNDAGSDDQTISDLSLSGTTLQLTLEGDANGQQTLDLSSLKDGVGTDAQNLTYTSGTHSIDIDNGNNAVIPLATTSVAGLATAAQITAIGTNTSNISTNATNIGTNDTDIATNALGVSGNTTDIAALEAIAKTVSQSFEVESNSSSATSYTLSVAAATTQACVVSYNGNVLNPTADFEFASSTSLQINVPVYQYDKIVISYKSSL